MAELITEDAVLPDGSVVFCVKPGHDAYEAVADAVARRLAGEPNGKVAMVLESGIVSLAQVHAPHEVTIAGTKYRGGEFIPQAALNKMDPKERTSLLDEEHVRADDDGNVIAHFGAGAHTDKKLGSIAGDKGFDGKAHKYFDAHLGRVADAFDEEAGKDAESARDNAEQAVLEVAEHYASAVSQHLKARFQDFYDHGDEEAFKKSIDEHRDGIVDAIYAAAASGEQDDYDEAAALVRGFADGIKEYADTLEGEIQAAVDDDEEADQAQQDEVAEQFDGLREDVEAKIDDAEDQDAVNAAWDEVVRDYNGMLDKDGGENPYRISLDDTGNLEVVHGDDLPDEYRPAKK